MLMLTQPTTISETASCCQSVNKEYLEIGVME